jgi:hypothetical protein
MPEKPGSVLYNETAIWAKIVAWLAVGIGGLVCVPIGLYGLTWWLLVLAVPLLLLGLVLLQTRLHMAVERETGDVVVTNRLLGLKIHTRRYPWSDRSGRSATSPRRSRIIRICGRVCGSNGV